MILYINELDYLNMMSILNTTSYTLSIDTAGRITSSQILFNELYDMGEDTNEDDAFITDFIEEEKPKQTESAQDIVKRVTESFEKKEIERKKEKEKLEYDLMLIGRGR